MLNARTTSARAGACRGFTLIELMLVSILVAILGAIALPCYQAQITKSRRADAFSSLSALVQAQERWRSNNAAYAATLAALNLQDISSAGHYRLSVAAVGNAADLTSGFEAHATPIASGRQSRDSECSDIYIRVSGGNLQYLDAGGLAKCWPQ